MKTVRLTTAAGDRPLPDRAAHRRSTATEAPLFPGVFAIFGHGNVTCLGRARRGARRAADLARAERAGHGARRRRLREGDAPPPDHGGDVVDRPRRDEHGDRRGRGAWPTGCRCCCCRATPSRAACPTPCCSRSSTSATPRPRSTTPSARSSATGTGSRGPSSCCSRCRRPSRRCSTPPTAARRSSACPRTCRPRRTTSRRGFFEPVVHEVAAPAARPRAQLAAAAELLRGARRPLLIAGGGVHYSLRRGRARALRRAPRHAGGRDGGRQVEPRRRPPVLRRADRRHRLRPRQPARRRGRRRARRRHPPAGLHDRLVDGVRRRGRCASSALNVARFDAVKHLATAVMGDARETLASSPRCSATGAPTRVDGARGDEAAARWPSIARPRRRPADDATPTYAQVVGAVNGLATADDYVRDGGRRLPRRAERQLALAGVGDVRLRVRLLVHGLRDLRRLGRARWPGGPDGGDRRSSATART